MYDWRSPSTTRYFRAFVTKRYVGLSALCVETTTIGLHFAADNISLSSLKFLWWAPEDDYISVRGPGFGRSRSSKVIHDANRKHVCDFLLVRNSNLGPIAPFRRFRSFYVLLTPSHSTLIWGVFLLHQIAHVGVNVSMDLKLFGREIIFEVFQPMWSRYLNVTDIRTDRETDDMQSRNRALFLKT